MLGNNYIKINGESIPNPTSLSISDANIETIKVAEDGRDVGTVSRLGKRTFNFSFNSTSYGKKKIRDYCLLAEVVLTFNNEQISGRLRIKDEKLVAGSEKIARSDGLWTISVSFMEL